MIFAPDSRGDRRLLPEADWIQLSRSKDVRPTASVPLLILEKCLELILTFVSSRTRLIALAAQKFLSDVVHETRQYHDKNQTASAPKKKVCNGPFEFAPNLPDLR